MAEASAKDRISRIHLREDLVGSVASDALQRSRESAWLGFISIDRVIPDDNLPVQIVGLPLPVVGWDENDNWLVAAHPVSSELCLDEFDVGGNPAAALIVPDERLSAIAGAEA